MKLYYIAGYGRSGSTALAAHLAQEHDAVMVGEAVAFGGAGASEACSCGRALFECPFWRSIVARRDGVRMKGVSLRQYDRRWLLFVPLRVLERLMACGGSATGSMQLYREIGVAAQRLGASAVVDASKTTRDSANRARMYHLAGYDVQLYLPQRRVYEVIKSVRAARKRRAVDSWFTSGRVIWGLFSSRMAAHILAKKVGKPVGYIDMNGIVLDFADGSGSIHSLHGNRMIAKG